MNRRQLLTLVAVFLVGVLVGMVVVGSSDDLRTSLFGTAGGDGKAKQKLSYYLVELDAAQAWLAEQYPDDVEKLETSVDVLAKLPATINAPVDYKAAEEDVEFLLPRAYAAILGIKDLEELEDLEIAEDDPTSICLALDDDPYQGPTMVLYVTLRAEQAEELDIPKDWEKLARPKTKAMYWKLLACYPEPESDKDAASK